MTLTPGQDVWYVPTRGNARALTVEKVGRKWVTFTEADQKRVAIGSVEVEVQGFGRVGILYPSREAWVEKGRIDAAWFDVQRDLYRKTSRPAGVTLEDINAARRLLGLEVLP